jgi:hypothetical protein
MYEKIYIAFYLLANYQTHGMLVCRLMALLVPIPFLLLSRLASSPLLKLLSIPVALLFYVLPWIVKLFADVVAR